MRIALNVSALALCQVVEGACKLIGFKVGAVGMEQIVGFLTERFTDQSQRLPNALDRATRNAWKALETALAGESLWNCLDRADDKAFRRQVRVFLEATTLANLPGHGPEFRQVCLRELRTAR